MPYVSAIDTTLSDRVDLAQLVKVYRATPEGERRYSPAEVVTMETVPVLGHPDPERICTSYVERQNLIMDDPALEAADQRSKKWENLWAALCLHFAFYNFRRIHRTIRVHPGQAELLRV